MKKYFLLGILLIFSTSTAYAEDEEFSEAVPMKHRSHESFELRLGIGGGGPVGLLRSVKGVTELTTEKYTGVGYLRLRLPHVSSRILEVYGVYPNGVGINLKNDDFRLGNFRFSFVDVGVFWNIKRPVSVQRVKRKFDLTLGTSVEYKVTSDWSFALDYRIFAPANVFGILTDYGDYARLIGREIAQGGQLWGGFSYSW